MATTYLVGRRGALYYIGEGGTPGTYVAPTQASDKALRIFDFSLTLADAGGVVRIEDDETPYGGGSIPILDGIAAAASFKLRLPAWPGSQPHARADHPALYDLLASCPMTADTTDELIWSPTSSFVAGTAPVTGSLTFLETNGNVYALRACVAIIESIDFSDTGIVASMQVHGLMQSTLADTVRTLSQASLTIADVAYTSGDNSWLLSRGATLTITGDTGSGVFAVRGGSVDLGQAIERQVDKLATHGYGVSLVSTPRNSAMSLTCTALDASAWAIEDDMLAQTSITALSLSWGSAASRFAIALGSVNRVESVGRGEDAGVRMFDVSIIGAPSSAGNDQYTLTWGTGS